MGTDSGNIEFNRCVAASGQMLHMRRLGIDTYQEPVVFLCEDSPVCRSMGFESQSRVELHLPTRHILATLNVVRRGGMIKLAEDEAGLSEAAWRKLRPQPNECLCIDHPAPVESFSHVRAKVFGYAFTSPALHEIVGDIAGGRYSNIELAAFVTACAGERLSVDETTALTRAMVATGSRLSWTQRPVMDKHCVGGLPGNRTTLILVPIVAALGLTIPKTSSRAITSPSGTADTMETLAPVSLDIDAMRRVVDREGGCIVWGGAVSLSPADDILIRVERPLDIDSDAQLVASVISKKVAAGSTHVIIDMPVGATAKIRSVGAAQALTRRLIEVGRALGLQVDVVLTDGSQPVGRGIGPALEARDALGVLRNEPGAAMDLRDRSVLLAGHIIELAGRASPNCGAALAAQVLADGRAWKKFQAIAEAQGGMREPPVARERHTVAAERTGAIAAIDNRHLSRVAKLAGAPLAKAAGVDLHVAIGDEIANGQPLFTIHAQSGGELRYSLDYVDVHPGIIKIKEVE